MKTSSRGIPHPLDDERRVHTWTGSLGIEHYETPSNAGFWFRSGREYGIVIIFLEKGWYNSIFHGVSSFFMVASEWKHNSQGSTGFRRTWQISIIFQAR